jgi:hypothetical protein
VRLHADGDTDHDVGAHLVFAREGGEAVDLLERVDDDPPHLGFYRPSQLSGRLVVAVQADPLRRETGGERDGQFAAAADVEA